MKGLTIKFENGKIGSVTSEAQMHDDGEFYCVVLCDGEFKKTNVEDIKYHIVTRPVFDEASAIDPTEFSAIADEDLRK